MTPRGGKVSKTYDQIVRETVVDPDSSVRPSVEQEKAAREGYWALDADEGALRDRVQAALSSAGPAASGIQIDVSRDLVTLSGRVSDPATLRTLENAVARVPGVATIHNQVVVGS